jgi:hypothetical protein
VFADISGDRFWDRNFSKNNVTDEILPEYSDRILDAPDWIHYLTNATKINRI